MIEPTEERKDDKCQNRPHSSQPHTPCASDNANRCGEPTRTANASRSLLQRIVTSSILPYRQTAINDDLYA